MLAWHFLGDDRMMRDGQGPVQPGDVYTHAGPIEICASGLHASERLIDALQYAPGCVVQRVECRDVTDTQPDKLVCRERRTLWLADARPVLVTFARWCADRAYAADAADAARARAYANAAVAAYAAYADGGAGVGVGAYAAVARAYADADADARATAAGQAHADAFERAAQNAELTRAAARAAYTARAYAAAAVRAAQNAELTRLIVALGPRQLELDL